MPKTTNGGIVTGLGQRLMAGFAYSHINLRLALVKSSIKHLVAQFIIRVQLIKVELIIVRQALGQLGQRLLTTAHKTRQRVLALLKRGK